MTGPNTPRQPRRFTEGTWLNEPRSITSMSERRLEVDADTGPDFWRDPYYGFTTDSGHALLFDLPPGKALEVTITTRVNDQFDQAGPLVRRNASHWVKAGVERAEGFVCARTVATDGRSDLSRHPVAEWWTRLAEISPRDWTDWPHLDYCRQSAT